eukprot:7385338-Prymnesium_polylepis.1
MDPSPAVDSARGLPSPPQTAWVGRPTPCSPLLAPCSSRPAAAGGERRVRRPRVQVGASALASDDRAARPSASDRRTAYPRRSPESGRRSSRGL